MIGPTHVHASGFPADRLRMGGTSSGRQSVNGGRTHELGHKPYGGGPNFDRLYHKLKVMLMLSCNYMLQLHDAILCCNSVKTH